MKLLTREAILKANDVQYETVKVPEWKGQVRVRPLTGFERDQFEMSMLDDQGQQKMENVRARLVALSVVDGDGKRIFSDADVHALGEKNSSALDRIFDVAKRLSRIGPREMDELLGNSGKAPGASS
jgi:hypothetical protein